MGFSILRSEKAAPVGHQQRSSLVLGFIGFRFSAAGGSGFGCQQNELLSPDTSFEITLI
jgi:hypothetical protein